MAEGESEAITNGSRSSCLPRFQQFKPSRCNLLSCNVLSGDGKDDDSVHTSESRTSTPRGSAKKSPRAKDGQETFWSETRAQELTMSQSPSVTRLPALAPHSLYNTTSAASFALDLGSIANRAAPQNGRAEQDAKTADSSARSAGSHVSRVSDPSCRVAQVSAFALRASLSPRAWNAGGAAPGWIRCDPAKFLQLFD